MRNTWLQFLSTCFIYESCVQQKLFNTSGPGQNCHHLQTTIQVHILKKCFVCQLQFHRGLFLSVELTMRHFISANDSVPHRCQGIARTADDPVTQHHTVSVLIQRHDLTNKVISIIKIRRPYNNLIIIMEIFTPTNMVFITKWDPTRSGCDILCQGFLAPVKYCHWYPMCYIGKCV